MMMILIPDRWQHVNASTGDVNSSRDQITVLEAGMRVGWRRPKHDCVFSDLWADIANVGEVCKSLP